MSPIHFNPFTSRIWIGAVGLPLLLSSSALVANQLTLPQANPSPSMCRTLVATGLCSPRQVQVGSADSECIQGQENESTLASEAIALTEQESVAFDASCQSGGSCAEDAACADMLCRAADPQGGMLSAQLLPSARVIQSTGAIEADVNAFRALLGDPNNNALVGQQPAGRREINWDAVPAALTNVPKFPNNFFNSNSARGLIYNNASRALEVNDQRFANINPTYAAEFNPFSGQKMFSPLGSNVSDVKFRVAGSGVEASVRGFGVVFLDVDTQNHSSIELFADDGHSLGKFTAPVRSDARGASFVGVVLRNAVISRVVIVAGDGRLAPNENDISQGGQHDLVALDDFLYSEPIATGP
jgi:hypothetical protein